MSRAVILFLILSLAGTCRGCGGDGPGSWLQGRTVTGECVGEWTNSSRFVYWELLDTTGNITRVATCGGDNCSTSAGYSVTFSLNQTTFSSQLGIESTALASSVEAVQCDQSSLDNQNSGAPVFQCELGGKLDTVCRAFQLDRDGVWIDCNVEPMPGIECSISFTFSETSTEIPIPTEQIVYSMPPAINEEELILSNKSLRCSTTHFPQRPGVYSYQAQVTDRRQKCASKQFKFTEVITIPHAWINLNFTSNTSIPAAAESSDVTFICSAGKFPSLPSFHWYINNVTEIPDNGTEIADVQLCQTTFTSYMTNRTFSVAELRNVSSLVCEVNSTFGIVRKNISVTGVLHALSTSRNDPPVFMDRNGTCESNLTHFPWETDPELTCHVKNYPTNVQNQNISVRCWNQAENVGVVVKVVRDTATVRFSVPRLAMINENMTCGCDVEYGDMNSQVGENESQVEEEKPTDTASDFGQQDTTFSGHGQAENTKLTTVGTDDSRNTPLHTTHSSDISEIPNTKSTCDSSTQHLLILSLTVTAANVLITATVAWTCARLQCSRASAKSSSGTVKRSTILRSGRPSDDGSEISLVAERETHCELSTPFIRNSGDLTLGRDGHLLKSSFRQTVVTDL